MTNLLGDIKIAKELGYKGVSYHKYIWHACMDCGKLRWVRLLQGVPQSPRCKSCCQRGDKNTNWGKRSHNWKGGVCHSGGYIRIFAPAHPRCHCDGYVKRATLVLEQKLGRYLLDGCVPHHINEIKDDDRPDNLEELPYEEHSKLHNREFKKAEHMRKFRHPQQVIL